MRPTRLTRFVIGALRDAPFSLRRLAQEAGVPQSTLTRIKAGDLQATPPTARKVAGVLQRWGRQCNQAAERLGRELRDSKRKEARMYVASRGGHAPGHLRDAFEEWLEGWLYHDQETPTIDEEPVDAEWLLGQLWNCTDIMGSWMCDEFELPPGSTFAMGVRRFKQNMGRRR